MRAGQSRDHDEMIRRTMPPIRSTVCSSFSASCGARIGAFCFSVSGARYLRLAMWPSRVPLLPRAPKTFGAFLADRLLSSPLDALSFAVASWLGADAETSGAAAAGGGCPGYRW